MQCLVNEMGTSPNISAGQKTCDMTYISVIALRFQILNRKIFHHNIWGSIYLPTILLQKRTSCMKLPFHISQNHARLPEKYMWFRTIWKAGVLLHRPVVRMNPHRKLRQPKTPFNGNKPKRRSRPKSQSPLPVGGNVHSISD